MKTGGFCHATRTSETPAGSRLNPCAFAAAVLVASLRRFGPRPHERNVAAALYFLRWVGAAAAGLSVVAILSAGLTAVIVPACK